MRLLELFSGTGSVGNVAKKMGYDVISLDISSKSATHRCDILKWKYKMYPVGYFDVIWASPPCTEFSMAKTIGVRNIKYGTKLVKAAFHLIDFFKPKWYVVENPQGLLRLQPMMKKRTDRKTVSYCKYGFPYRKHTDLWTNSPFAPKKCEKGHECDFARKHHYHPQTVQTGSDKRKIVKCTPQLSTRYSIPAPLIRSIFRSFI